MHPLLRASALFASLALSAHAQTTTVLFADTFATTGQSDDVNSQYTAGRQSGALGNLQYRQGNGSFGTTITGTVANEASTGYKTQIGNASGPGTLWLVGGQPAVSFGGVSPEHNFTENGGVGGYLSISFTLDPNVGAAGTTASWGAITLGSADHASFGASGSGARGQSINTSAAHFGFLFRDNGAFQAFDGGTTLVSNGTYDATPTVGTTHSVELRITGLVDGNPWDGSGDARIDVYADGSIAYTYTKTGGYTSNFITLQGEGDPNSLIISQFDNFQIATVSAVPEPSSFALLAGGAMMLAVGFRRRGRR